MKTERPGKPDTPDARSVDDLFDELVRRLGFDSRPPVWTDELRALHRHSRRTGIQILPDYFYTSAFSPEAIPTSVWEGSFPDCGSFEIEAQRAFLRGIPPRPDELAKMPSSPPPPTDAVFWWGNDQFGHADAAVYYAMLRHFRPARIVEIGSGYSTMLALSALRANGSGRITCVEPYGPVWLRSVAGPVEVLARPVQDVPAELFSGLAPNDILFIDGSHISKTGSDVNHLFLRVLPNVPAGVFVHVHDICLPFEYPRVWSEQFLCYWNEQYVLAGLLANSRKYEVILGTYFLGKTDPAALQPFLPPIPGVGAGGGSLWMVARE